MTCRATTALTTLTLLALTLAAPPAGAQPKLTTSDFKIDLFQGPILGSTRVTGLGGAYTAVAEGTVGIPYNPATVAYRPYYSVDRFDWDIAFDYMIPGIFQGDDFDLDNNGHQASIDAQAFVFGGHIQYKAWGIGAYARGTTFEATESGANPRTFHFWLWLIQLAFGYSFLDHQLILGGGLRYGVFMALHEQQTLFQLQTIGGEVGALYAPLRWPFRLGVSFSLPLAENQPVQCDAATNPCPQGMVLPTEVALPWELRIGAAFYIGARPFNRTPSFLIQKPTAPVTPPASAPVVDIHAASRPASAPAASAPAARPKTEQQKKPKPDLDRDYRGGRYVMFSVELDINGAVDDAIGTDGFIDQVRERSGESISLSPHLGVESEVWRRRLRLRAGAYYEPTRFAASSGRFHGTFSCDLRLFDFSLWGEHSVRVGAGFDLAPRYSNIAFTAGFWH
jgi:hypothetical protein